jgi:hypothetical protein
MLSSGGGGNDRDGFTQEQRLCPAIIFQLSGAQGKANHE